MAWAWAWVRSSPSCRSGAPALRRLTARASRLYCKQYTSPSCQQFAEDGKEPWTWGQCQWPFLPELLRRSGSGLVWGCAGGHCFSRMEDVRKITVLVGNLR